MSGVRQSRTPARPDRRKLAATRMLAECGGIRDGLCINLGCGAGHLDVELAKRSNLKIIGLDIDRDMKPL